MAIHHHSSSPKAAFALTQVHRQRTFADELMMALCVDDERSPKRSVQKRKGKRTANIMADGRPTKPISLDRLNRYFNPREIHDVKLRSRSDTRTPASTAIPLPPPSPPHQERPASKSKTTIQILPSSKARTSSSPPFERKQLLPPISSKEPESPLNNRKSLAISSNDYFPYLNYYLPKMVDKSTQCSLKKGRSSSRSPSPRRSHSPSRVTNESLYSQVKRGKMPFLTTFKGGQVQEATFAVSTKPVARP